MFHTGSRKERRRGNKRALIAILKSRRGRAADTNDGKKRGNVRGEKKKSKDEDDDDEVTTVQRRDNFCISGNENARHGETRDAYRGKGVFFNFATLMQPHSRHDLPPFVDAPSSTLAFEEAFLFRAVHSIVCTPRRVPYARRIHLHKIPAI